jgi:hypothetical protein
MPDTSTTIGLSPELIGVVSAGLLLAPWSESMAMGCPRCPGSWWQLKSRS